MGLTADTFHTYTWDAEGRVVTIDGVGITYDALGRQVDYGSGAQKIYPPGANTQIAVMSGQTLTYGMAPLPGGGRALYSSTGLWLYQHADWLGNARVLSTPSRGVGTDNAYAPFGENYDSTGNPGLAFTGVTTDTASGLYDFLYRKYSDRQGRWLSPDPAGLAAVDPTNPQTWNRYAYVANNPLSYVDPLGLNQDACTAKHPCSGNNSPGSTTDPGFSFSPTGGNGSVWSTALSGVTIITTYYFWVPIDPTGYPPIQTPDVTARVLSGGYWDSYSIVSGVGGGTNAANNFPNVTAAPPQQPPLKPGCTKAGLWAGLKAAGQDLIPVPPQFNTDPVSATGDFLTSKQGQAAAIGVLYQVANGARYIAPFADAAADFVPIAGQLWLAYQVGHALYQGGVAYKAAIDQCYGGG